MTIRRTDNLRSLGGSRQRKRRSFQDRRVHMRQTHISINISKCGGEKRKKGNDDKRNCIATASVCLGGARRLFLYHYTAHATVYNVHFSE